MALFQPEPNRVNRVTTQAGAEYQRRVVERVRVIFPTLLNLLPSPYTSSVQGPQYTNELKAVAVELAKVELALDDIQKDRSYADTRTDFLFSLVGYLVFLNGKLPNTGFDDVEFKRFLLAVIKIYFKGSIPTAIREGVSLFLADNVTITENFLLIRQGASGYDISDQFGFQINIDNPSGAFPVDVFGQDANIRLIVDILRPAHTLFSIRYLFHDHYNPNNGSGVLDALRWRMSNYYYEDFRQYWEGIRDRDRLGAKVNGVVVGESHSADF